MIGVLHLSPADIALLLFCFLGLITVYAVAGRSGSV